ncbi:winged helix-turn-helix domain-containing protein [Jiangella alba]|uniref:Transcriptional regulatory protein, C terminal n=1 Tax=Jiangella alba TaxID=561176 RepID=A0A1H5DPD7_9ACTN|nr:winged helix-turn-helix domain-containing protein [Jiangella alba]SED80668.1 Transcriptional regulatory protein, C terminal [Jiangella alba]
MHSAGRTTSERARSGPPVVSVGAVTLDVDHRLLATPGGREVALTPLQAALLAHLMDRPGLVCTREELMCQALGYPVPVGTRTVDVHVATLRGKLGGALTIRSVRGVGYALDPVQEG